MNTPSGDKLPKFKYNKISIKTGSLQVRIYGGGGGEGGQWAAPPKIEYLNF